MNAITAVGLLAAFGVGAVVGWLVHAARAGDRLARAEATLHAIRENEQTLQQSLNAVNADSARRHSGAIGDQLTRVVGPLREAVGALSNQVQQIEHSRVNAYAGLTEQVAGMQRASQLLSNQAGQLVTALRAPQVRGRWGEVQLERVVELSGMSKHCDFSTQVSAVDAVGDGARSVRPDLIVRLAGGKQLIVDAKVPFSAYLDALDTEDPAERARHMSRHAGQLRTHIDQLSAKAYWRSFDPTPEFVVLFVPGDPFLDAALSTAPELLEYAFAKNVVLATPTTLIALLRTVAHMWRQDALSRDAATIHKLGKELHSRLDTVAGHLDRVGTQLGKAVDAFNSTAASMESRVMVTARKLTELEVSTTEPTEIRQVEAWPRTIGAPETRDTHRDANPAC
ncbi:DNA recombination protein RmuC [Speluncibacter jeojiensis]|uniref:DNA recombination protein RmuC n=1 Tax=Speluncibacter jeojiensis TaxID=2710754 RepID=A0A9X4M0R7_9ACTN|nr:DNA recombination protein RmuC [Corynebacteriales bacterium D3-21]